MRVSDSPEQNRSADMSAIADALNAFVNTSTPGQAMAILKQHAELLLSDEAVRILETNRDRHRDDAEALGVFDLRLRAIMRAREHGIEAGLAELYQPDPAVLQVVLGFVNAPGYYGMFEQLRAHEVLLRREAEECLEMLKMRNARDTEACKRIESCISLLAQARNHDLDSARVMLRNGLIDALQREGASALGIVDAWQDALRLTNSATEGETWAGIQVKIGNVLRARAQANEPAAFDLAVTCLEAALTVFTREGHLDHFSGIHRVLGNICVEDPRPGSNDRFSRALEHYRRSLEGISAERDPENYLHVHLMMGICFGTLGQPIQARAHFRDGLVGVRRADLNRAIGICTELAGLITGGGTDTAAALQQALATLEQRVSQLAPGVKPNQLASAHFQLGNLYRELLGPEREENVERSISHTLYASQIWTHENDPDRWAQTQHNLGAAYYIRIKGERADNLEQAIQYYRNALTVHTVEAYPRSWALTHNALGSTLLNRLKGDPQDNAEAAVQMLEAALSVWTIEEHPFHWAECHNSLGGAWTRLADRKGSKALERAVSCFEQSASIHTKERYPNRWAQAQSNLANAYLERGWDGDRERSLAILQQAIATADRGAESYHWAVLKRNEAAALSHFSDTDPNKIDAALTALCDCLPVFDLEHYPADHRKTQMSLGHLWLRRGEWARALDAYQQAIVAAERIFMRAYTETGRLSEAGELSSIYRNAAFCLVKLGRPDEAFALHDRGKARLLADAMSLSEARFDELPAAKRLEADIARQEVALLEDEMRLPESAPRRRTEAELGRLLAASRERLARAFKEVQAMGGRVMDKDHVLHLIPENGVLVTPLLTAGEGVAFVVPHGATTITDDHILQMPIGSDEINELLVGSEECPGLFRAYARFVNSRASEERDVRRREFDHFKKKLNEVCQRLWPAVMGPVYERLAENGMIPQNRSSGRAAQRQGIEKTRTPVLLMPHGALSLLPLHAAFCASTESGATGSFVDNFDVHYAPSASVLARARGRLSDTRGPARLLAIANPGGDLNFAGLECLEIARAFAGGEREVLPGAAATRAAVEGRVGNCTHLHFSCHGFYAWWDPLRSGLVLADLQVLELAEIMSSRFNLGVSRLVTLSACETGISEYRRSPDEYVGLSAGLLLAGAPAVISSLWAVEERATTLLMSEFFRRHVAGESPATALCAAQRWLASLTFTELSQWVSERCQRYRAEKEGIPGIEQAIGLLDEWSDLLALLGLKNPTSRPYAHPYYWAAFTAIGAV